MQHSVRVSHPKVEVCEVQKQNGKLVFSKSEVFFIYGTL